MYSYICVYLVSLFALSPFSLASSRLSLFPAWLSLYSPPIASLCLAYLLFLNCTLSLFSIPLFRLSLSSKPFYAEVTSPSSPSSPSFTSLSIDLKTPPPPLLPFNHH